jgi:3-oxoacyl-[acyl-carrier-protein] synthase-3
VVDDHASVRAASPSGQVRRVRISGLATYVPPRLLTNKDLETMVDTTEEWILQRTGIRERHIVDPGVASSDLGKEAAIKALAGAGLTPSDVDLIIVGTVTPDMMFPSTACLVQHKIGAPKAWGFDLSAGCSAFTFSLATAAELVATGHHDCALVVGADVMSSIIDYQDRATCVLFGDGAGAAVVTPAADDGLAIIDFAHEIDGSGGPALNMPAGGSLHPPSHETVEKRMHYVKQDGQTVFKFAVRKTEEICRVIMERNGITADDIDLFVSHQANRRIIMSAANKLGLDERKVVINIERYGNTTAATIPLALEDAINDGRLKKGDLVLLASVGAGFTIGSVLLRWAY